MNQNDKNSLISKLDLDSVYSHLCTAEQAEPPPLGKEKQRPVVISTSIRAPRLELEFLNAPIGPESPIIALIVTSPMNAISMVNSRLI